MSSALPRRFVAAFSAVAAVRAPASTPFRKRLGGGREAQVTTARPPLESTRISASYARHRGGSFAPRCGLARPRRANVEDFAAVGRAPGTEGDPGNVAGGGAVEAFPVVVQGRDQGRGLAWADDAQLQRGRLDARTASGKGRRQAERERSSKTAAPRSGRLSSDAGGGPRDQSSPLGSPQERCKVCPLQEQVRSRPGLFRRRSPTRRSCGTSASTGKMTRRVNGRGDADRAWRRAASRSVSCQSSSGRLASNDGRG